MRWLFLEDGSAIQTCHITRLFYNEDVTQNRYTVKASLPGPAHPFVVAHYNSEETAREAIKDMVVGREYKRS